MKIYDYWNIDQVKAALSIVKWQRWETIFRHFLANTWTTINKSQTTMAAQIHDFLLFMKGSSVFQRRIISHFYRFTYGIWCCADAECSCWCRCRQLFGCVLLWIPFIRRCDMAFDVVCMCIHFGVAGGCWITHIRINISTDCFICFRTVYSIHRMPNNMCAEGWTRNYNEKQ